MCGIAGLYAPGRHLDAESVVPMLDSMSHRGPDDRGSQVLAGGALVLGHLRLSILDLSALGHQPMACPERKAWISYNGEIYNFRAIRRELKDLGSEFRSDSDTEVLLAAYRQWGLAATLDRLHGMFAFALWDELEQTLHLCRDRFGVKPLYYSVFAGELAFASEARALVAAGCAGDDADPLAVAEFLQYGYVSAPRSMYGRIRKLPPGTVLSFDRALRATERTYWRCGDCYDGDEAERLRRELASLPDEALIDRVETSLLEAFELRMVADVPVGLFLSGGIDSSLVAALLARRAGLRLNTFTIGYGNPEFDETPYARRVATELNTQHVELIVSAQKALELAAEIPAIADEPIGDSSLIPTLMVSRLARQYVKVALSADGADELFGGYARYHYCGEFVGGRSRILRTLYLLSAEVLDRVPPGLVARAYAMARGGGPKYAAIGDKLRKFVRMARARDAYSAYEAATSEWTADESRSLCAHPAAGEFSAAAQFNAVTGADVRDRFMHFDSVRYLPGDLLTKVDRASMYVSLEAREPFLDHATARVAAALPMRWKIRDGRGKYVLRRILARHLRAEIFDRPKQGFTAPIGAWLRGPLRHVFLEEISTARVREAGLLDPKAVSEATGAFLANGAHAGSAAGFWFLLQLQQWATRWLHAGAPRMSAAVNRS